MGKTPARVGGGCLNTIGLAKIISLIAINI